MNENTDDMKGLFNDRPQKEALAPRDFDIVVDKKTSKIWILHETAFIHQDEVSRAKYNHHDHSLRFVSDTGKIQYLGAPVQKPLQQYLEKADEIKAVLMDGEGNIQNVFTVPLEHTDKV